MRNSSLPHRSVVCRLVGHRWRFRAEDADLTWHCTRGCGPGGRLPNAGESDARTVAARLNRNALRAPDGLLVSLGESLARRR